MPSSLGISLKEFCKQNDTNFDLEHVDLNVKQAVWEQCLNLLNRSENDAMLLDAVICMRILTREEVFRSKFNEEILSKLVNFIDPTQSKNLQSGVVLESLKALSNIIFKKPSLITYLKSINILSHSVGLIKSSYPESRNCDIVLLALKILFLLSGLDSSTRFELADQLNALDLFINLFNTLDESHLNISDTDLVLEALKALFNILLILRNREDLKTKYIHDVNRLVKILRNFLICPSVDGSRTELISRVVHLLTVSPKRCYKFLLCSPTVDHVGKSTIVSENQVQSDFDQSTHVLLNDPEMQAIDVLLDYLNLQLESYQPDHPTATVSGVRINEALCPILEVITRLCQSNRAIRKYCRLKILPYLGKEVTRLPEEGSTLRNRLCKLLTNPLEDVSELAANLIFILCKENIGRAVKYTGFGNFAGFLARHALLGRSKHSTHQLMSENQSKYASSNENISEEPYSTDSSNSDTEEYDRLRDNVNPVTGRWEVPKADPMNGMTDEQKEYLAMELVQKIDQLQRSGVIQPGTIGEDGRVKPVEHILELLNQNAKEETSKPDSESDE